MKPEIGDFNARLPEADRRICDLLAQTIDRHLPEAEGKVWHAHPVWFLEGNPTVGYSRQKRGIRLMFWSGASFDEPRLDVLGGKFRDASIFFRSIDEVDLADLERWLTKSRQIVWDYRGVVKRKGVLQRLR